MTVYSSFCADLAYVFRGGGGGGGGVDHFCTSCNDLKFLSAVCIFLTSQITLALPSFV